MLTVIAVAHKAAPAATRLQRQIGVHMTPAQGEFVIVLLLAVVVIAAVRAITSRL